MIESVPHRWRSVRASVGDSVEVPTDAESVSLLPAAEDSDEVTVSFFVSDFIDEFDTDPETESRPIQTETIARDETSRTFFRRYPTIVPAPDGESATVYFLGETDEERRML
jgi:hypothetical protein